jgi:hypothetical protein
VESISDRIITAPIGEFCVLSGLGRTIVYEMMGDGRLDPSRWASAGSY